MSPKPSTAHVHVWHYRELMISDDGSNMRYNGSKRGWKITGYICACSARDYTDFINPKSIDTIAK